jgi:predicted phosphate transport protein (TIGR00153 family)
MLECAPRVDRGQSERKKSMFRRFMPSEGQFFELFNQHAGLALDASQILVKLIEGLPESAHYAEQMLLCEKKADRITHDTVELLHSTFITPIDRDAIHKLITTMDDILDLGEDIVETIQLYNITLLTNEALQLANICVACCQCVKNAVSYLNNMRNAREILKICAEIDSLESDADRVLRTAMSKLFREEDDVKHLIKVKAVYELLETITDKCEDVANIIEGIVLENA